MELRAEGIRKQFLRKRGDSNVFNAVEKTDITLSPGTLTVLSGRSGSGKSTLLYMLAGLQTPTEGKVTCDGQDIYAMSDKALSRFRGEKIGIVPQGQSAVASLNVLENILLPQLLGRAKADLTERALALMEELGIAELKAVMPSELSGGELRRAAICRALVNDPEIIFADEPTGDLDDESTKAVMRALRARAEAGKTVLIVTHDRDVLEYADRKYTMEKGVVSESRGAEMV